MILISWVLTFLLVLGLVTGAKDYECPCALS